MKSGLLRQARLEDYPQHQPQALSLSPTRHKGKQMTANFTTSYAAIIKQEKQDDGTLLVYGKATDDSLDIDQQICDAAWLEKAMPEWFKTGGNIREQHSSIAAGVAKELDSKPDGHYISALVVDAQSVKKVETGVLKGFSIGIRAPRIVRDNKAANGRIIDGQIVEVSLVDRPANPNAKLMLAKSNGTEVVQMEQFIEKEEETPVATTEPTEVIEAEVVEAETAPVEAEEAKADMPSKEDALKALEDLRANLMAHEKLCKELGYLEEDDKALEPVGESAEEETEEGSEAGAAEEEVEEAEGKKTVDGEPAEEVTPENSVEETEQPALDDDVIDAIVDKAVKSATATVRDEIKSYKEEIDKLQSELATAKNKAVGSGPKRAVVSKPAILEFNEFSRIAEQYRAKAADTSDNQLALGYRELAAEFEAKAVALINN
jgi:pSer/pThr/pTyr-binding forkhead associated (FHA) protein